MQGGEPQGNWSGLTDQTVEVKRNQFCPTTPSSAGKAQHYQTIGLNPQFEKSHDLQLLKINVNKHMNKFGLALLKYLPHPSDGTKVINVIDNHGLFDKKKGVTMGNKICSKHYNSYEKANPERCDHVLNELDHMHAQTQATTNMP